MRRIDWLAKPKTFGAAGALALAALLTLGAGGCGPSQQVELPPPDSGRFLSLEEQQALGGTQLARYCRMLDDYLVTLREDIALSRGMEDSLSTLLDSLNAEHSALNNEVRLLETQLRRLKARRKETTEYEVREGDTLMKLASLFYGKPQEWRKLYEANKEVIDDPGGELEPGTRLTVPR